MCKNPRQRNKEKVTKRSIQKIQRFFLVNLYSSLLHHHRHHLGYVDHLSSSPCYISSNEEIINASLSVRSISLFSWMWMNDYSVVAADTNQSVDLKPFRFNVRPGRIWLFGQKIRVADYELRMSWSFRVSLTVEEDPLDCSSLHNIQYKKKFEPIIWVGLLLLLELFCANKSGPFRGIAQPLTTAAAD